MKTHWIKIKQGDGIWLQLMQGDGQLFSRWFQDEREVKAFLVGYNEAMLQVSNQAQAMMQTKIS